MTEVTVLIKFVPVKITSAVCPTLPVTGAMLFKVGAGLFTIKGRVFEFPPPLRLTTKKLRAPVAALAVMVRFAVNCVALAMAIELTIIPAPTSIESSVLKLLPLKTTFKVCKRLPLAGLRLSRIGAFGKTVNFWLDEEPPPGALLAMEKSYCPTAAVGKIVIFAVRLVGLVTV